MSFERSSEQSSRPDIAEQLIAARKRTWDAVEAIARSIRPGMNESEAIRTAQTIMSGMGAKKLWHKTHVRMGTSTVLSFNDPYHDTVLQENDIFLIDIGPIFDGIEGDAGTTFVVGHDPERERIRDDAKTIFNEIKQHWLDTKANGAELYNYAGERAEARGWVLAPSYVRGHRLSEFPHSLHTQLKLGELDFRPSPMRWVLELHICDPGMKFGAFHEDLL